MVLLDVIMPDMSGLDICRHLKFDAATADIPIIIITSLSNEIDRIVALEIGVDDYVTKPFNPRELMLRIRSVLKRSMNSSPAPVIKQVGSLSLDTGCYSAHLSGRQLRLTPIEFKLLEALIDKQGYLQSREDLLKKVWPGNHDVTVRTVDTHIQRLREKLGAAASWIETVRGKGYKIVSPKR